MHTRLPELDSGHRGKEQSTDGDYKNENRKVHDSLVGFLLFVGREAIPAFGAAIYLAVWVFSAVRGLCFAYFICQRFLRHGANPQTRLGASMGYGDVAPSPHLNGGAPDLR